ncbi:MAG: recombinase family protein, partial [Defluviitaleaceae bacterium]|nr:recombinase family protein [Defluviitaleaceae bacterium]
MVSTQILVLITGIYVRVSTEEQAREGYSIRAQEEKLRAYALLKGWHIHDIYIDEGISGKDIDGRPQIKRLITDIERGKVNNVLVFKIDRLTRSTKNLIELMDLFNTHDCAFNSLSESIDTSTASGRMFLKIVGIFAEFERENLAERLRLGFERKVKEGYTLANFRQAYGYNKEKGSKTLEINEEQAQIVKRIFNMYLDDDYNLNKIARTLTAQQVPTKMGRRWASITVKEILKNPIYIGKVRYSVRDTTRYFEADGWHTPIIEESVFYEVQDKMGKIKKISYTKRPTAGVYFAGILVCSECGCKYSPKWNYRPTNPERRVDKTKPTKLAYPTYFCHNAHKGMGCSAKSMSHKKLEETFLGYIAGIGDVSAGDITQSEYTDNPDHSAEMTIIASEIGQIERKTKEVMELFMSGGLEFNEYKEMTKVGNERRKDLEERLDQL